MKEKTLKDIKRGKNYMMISVGVRHLKELLKMKESDTQGYYWCIRVQTLQSTIRLFLAPVLPLVESFETIGVPANMLIKAVKEAGGDINKNDNYLINEEAKQWLLRQLVISSFLHGGYRLCTET